MSLPLAGKLAIAGAAGLGLYWWLGGFGASSAGGAAAATAAGSKDGCDMGARDAKLGEPQNVNPTDDDTVQAAAKKSGNVAAYLAAYESSYADCWKKNEPITKVVTPTPAKEPPSKAPVATAYLDRFKALGVYLDGARQGARDGYKDGIAKSEDSYNPGYYAIGTGIPKAYRAGYNCGYGSGKSQAKVFDGVSPILVPKSLPKEQENHIVDSICAGTFGAWYDAHKADASVAGTCYECEESRLSREEDGAVIGWMKSTQVAGRVLLAHARPFHVARPHAMGWPAPMTAGGYK